MEDQQPSQNMKDTPLARVTGKKTKKSLKTLLNLKPPMMPGSSSQASGSQEVNADKIMNMNKENEYLLAPSGPYSFFEDIELIEYYEDFKTSSPDSIFISKSTDLADISLKFKPPLIRNNYCQYSYVKVPTLGLATNAYGFVIGNSENFTDKTILYSLAQLEPKHRVSLLLPTSDYWWNRTSSSTFKAFIELMGNNIKSLAMCEEFKNSMIRFGQDKNVLINFKNKYISATKIINDELVPAVFGVKMLNSNQFNSEIKVPMAKVLDDNSLEVSTGEDLMPPKFMHALLLLSVTGFKITKSGISIDTEINYLIYRSFQRLERKRQSLFSLQKHVVHGKRSISEANTSFNSSNFGESDDEQHSPKRYSSMPNTSFEMDW